MRPDLDPAAAVPRKHMLVIAAADLPWQRLDGAQTHPYMAASAWVVLKAGTSVLSKARLASSQSCRRYLEHVDFKVMLSAFELDVAQTGGPAGAAEGFAVLAHVRVRSKLCWRGVHSPGGVDDP